MRFFTRRRDRIGGKHTQLMRRQTKSAPFARLRVEPFEDRCVPTVFPVTSALDDAARHGTLRYALAQAGDGDTILLTPAVGPAGITLTQGELLIQHNLTITGVSNSNPVTISGGGQSRVFEIAKGASVAIANVTITGGNAQMGNADYEGRGGGVVVDVGGALTITDSTVTDNSALRGGGIDDFGALTVTRCTVSDNQARVLDPSLPDPGSHYGGGIAVFSGAPFSPAFTATATITDSTVSGNTAFENGGGIAGVVSTLTVSDSKLSSNSTDLYDGGGVNIHGGTLTMTRCTLSGNSAAGNGGGAFINAAFLGSVIPATADFSDCSVTDNTATYSGGGLLNFETVTVSGGTVSGNTTHFASGGGLFNVGTMTVTGVRLSDNTAQYGGGLLNVGTMTVSGGTLSGNTARFGGAAYNLADLTIDHCTLTGNSASDHGGAIYNVAFYGDTGLTISASTISQNTAVNFGGGIDNEGGAATVKNSSVITGNTAPAGNGADVLNFAPLYLDASSSIGVLDGYPAIPI